MIVLDEHLKDVILREDIERWYRGSVVFINELRPATNIQDDAVAELLRTVHEPTFVTINVSDFWRKIDADQAYCVLCLELSTKETKGIPQRLRRLLKLESLETRRGRLGKVVLVRPHSILWYTNRRQRAERIEWE